MCNPVLKLKNGLKLMPHPATQILVWVCLAIVLQTLSQLPLFACAALLLLLALKIHSQRLFSLMRRTRWIFLSLLLIYAFATPGHALWDADYAPTREGLQDGVLQLARLVCMLASLSILLTLLSRENLINGLYTLLYPARLIGLSRERIAVRLALTLHYAENAMRDTAVDWRAALNTALSGEAEGAEHIELRMRRLIWMDVVLLSLAALILIGIGL